MRSVVVSIALIKRHGLNFPLGKSKLVALYACLARISKLEEPHASESVEKLTSNSVNKEFLNADVTSVLVTLSA